MTTKHTPGPWKYGGPVKRESLLMVLKGASHPNGISKTVWELGRDDEQFPPGIAVINIRDKHSEADARLIAAAPTLYEFALLESVAGNKKAQAMLDSLNLNK